MDSISYEKSVKKVRERIQALYNSVGGCYLFYWVDSVHDRTIGFDCSAHFQDGGFFDVLKFFHEATRSWYLPTFADVNLWSVTTSTIPETAVYEGQGLVEAGRTGYVLRRLVESLDNALLLLQREGAPFLLYFLPDRLNAVGPITSYYPEVLGRRFVANAGWQNIISPSNRLVSLPAGPLVTPVKRQAPSLEDAQPPEKKKLKKSPSPAALATAAKSKPLTGPVATPGSGTVSALNVFKETRGNFTDGASGSGAKPRNSPGNGKKKAKSKLGNGGMGSQLSLLQMPSVVKYYSKGGEPANGVAAANQGGGEADAAAEQKQRQQQESEVIDLVSSD